MFTSEILKLSNEQKEKAVAIRRQLHKNPEPAFSEYGTSKIIIDNLKKLNIEIKQEVAGTGVIGLIKGKPGGKTLALRADMDALAVTEESSCEYKSVNPGTMHACGHDVHIACLLGAAEIIKSLDNEFAGNVKLVFQPAEETVSGALEMIKCGVFENPPVDSFAALHVWPDLEVGKIIVNDEYAFSAIDNFEILIKGRGGHGAMPHITIDPISLGCQVINALQYVVSRNINALLPAVMSICSFHSGESCNVIPDTATIKGTLRTFDEEQRGTIKNIIESTIKGIVNAANGQYEINYIASVPSTINNKLLAGMLADSAGKIIGKENISLFSKPSMVSEDFAFFSQKVPSVYFKLGCSNMGKNIAYPLHNSRFDVDEDCILIGSQILSQYALDYLMSP